MSFQLNGRQSWRRVLSIVLVAFASVFFASCGTRDLSQSETKAWDSRPLTSRISTSELAKIYSNETVTKAGRIWPVSKSSLRTLHMYNTSPDYFRKEWGVFTAGIETKGYINVGKLSPVLHSRLVTNMEAVTSWNTILDQDGNRIFVDAYTTDSRGNRIADQVDGRVQAAGERHFARLILKKLGIKISMPTTIDIYEKDGTYQVDITNYQPVKAPLIGTIIQTGNFKVHMKLFAHLNGWAVYAASAVKLDKLESQLDPQELDRMVDAMYWWFVNNTVLPLN